MVDTLSFGKYKRDVDDFTAAYSRRISYGRNRAGHSRDCVEYSFPGALSFSYPPGCLGREHLLFYHLTHALASRFPCVNAVRECRFHGETGRRDSANLNE